MKSPAAKYPPSQPAFCEVHCGLPCRAFCSYSLEEQRPTVSYSCTDFSMKLGWSSGRLRVAHGTDFFISRVFPSIVGSGNLSPDRPDSDCGTRDRGRTVLHTLALNNRSPSVSVPKGQQGSTLTSVRSWEMPICPDLLPLLFLLKAFRSLSEDGHQRSL